MGTIEIDESRFPLVTVRFDGVVDDATFEAYLAGLQRMLGRREPYALVLDASTAGPAPAKQRRRQAEWMAANEADVARWSVGAAFVITSSLTRGLLTAILWIQPMPQPHTVVATRREAEQWARERLRARGVDAR
jgi:hypothetical protein